MTGTVRDTTNNIFKWLLNQQYYTLFYEKCVVIINTFEHTAVCKSMP